MLFVMAVKQESLQAVILCAKQTESVIEINVTFLRLAELYMISATKQWNPVLIAFYSISRFCNLILCRYSKLLFFKCKQT